MMRGGLKDKAAVLIKRATVDDVRAHRFLRRLSCKNVSLRVGGHVDYILGDNIPVGRAGPGAGMQRGPGTYIFFRGSPHK